MNEIKAVVCCEESQAITKELRKLGVQAYSNDIKECSGGHPEWHIQDDCRHVLYGDWDLIISHPPCTRLSNAGTWRLHESVERLHELNEAIQFFKMFQHLGKHGLRVCIENPIIHSYAKQHLGKYSQKINPYNFGESYQKNTCLWLYNLPLIYPTKNVVPGKSYTAQIGAGIKQAEKRSKTFKGIAQAMAQQFVNYIHNHETKKRTVNRC